MPLECGIHPRFLLGPGPCARLAAGSTEKWATRFHYGGTRFTFPTLWPQKSLPLLDPRDVLVSIGLDVAIVDDTLGWLPEYCGQTRAGCRCMQCEGLLDTRRTPVRMGREKIREED